MRNAVIGISLLLVAGCPLAGFIPCGGVVCTEVYVYGMNVAVIDVSNNPITGAILTLMDGDYSETMEELAAGEYAGAGERAGTYTLKVEADGFVTQTIRDIVIDADECHVIPVAREVTLTAS